MYYKPDGYSEKKLNTWYYSLLIFVIPVFIFCASCNMVTRVADPYEWKFNKNAEMATEEDSDVLTLLDANVFLSESEFATEIADYINGKSDSIDTYDKEAELSSYYIQEAAEVSVNDYNCLKALRVADIILLVIGFAAFLYFAIFFFALVRDGYDTKEVMRDKFIKCIPVFAAMELMLLLITGIKPLRNAINSGILGLEHAKGDVIMPLLGTGFPFQVALFTVLIAVIIMIILFYITWICTKPRDIFNERRYFK